MTCFLNDAFGHSIEDCLDGSLLGDILRESSEQSERQNSDISAQQILGRGLPKLYHFVLKIHPTKTRSGGIVDLPIEVRMTGFGSQEDNDGVDGDGVSAVQKSVVGQNVDVFAGRCTGLELKVDHFRGWVVDSHDDVRSECYGREIDVQKRTRSLGRLIEFHQEVRSVVSNQILHRRVEIVRHVSEVLHESLACETQRYCQSSHLFSIVALNDIL